VKFWIQMAQDRAQTANFFVNNILGLHKNREFLGWLSNYQFEKDYTIELLVYLIRNVIIVYTIRQSN